MQLGDFKVGQRVRIHPASDRYRRGDVYGTVVKVARKYVHVRMDRSCDLVYVEPTLLEPCHGAFDTQGV